MSGIAGIFARDGAPVSRELLREMTAFMAFRGPDARDTWCGGACGFSHTMLRTTRQSAAERQPANLDSLWITADVRLDCRAELIAEIERAGRQLSPGPSDPDLLLHAYAAWGEQCVEHLRGEFSFAIWDAQRKVLFCARDHFGIKPFYYSECGNQFVFSNTLGCVQLHPGVSRELNEAVIGDFLVFGVNWDRWTTTWRDIQRLPAAHCLAAASDGVRVRRYWSAPTDACVRYSRAEDYVENFVEIFRKAVAERLSPDCTGIFLSGGMDSSAVAAMARETCDAGGGSMQLRAYTVISQTLTDSDAPCAREVADDLRIPIRCLNFDDLEAYEGWGDRERQFPEPPDDPLSAALFDEFDAVAKECRVALNGEGGDNLMHFQMLPYARHLLRRKEWKRFGAEGLDYLRVRPFPWRGMRYRIRLLLGKEVSGPSLPPWLRSDFVKSAGLEKRCREAGRLRPSGQSHPVLPKGHASLELPLWSRLFENEDPGVTRRPVETRFPFLDLRVVSYLLALPPFPWAFQKKLLRDAMRGRLPEGILRRPKTPLAEDPSAVALRHKQANRRGDDWTGEIERFVDRGKFELALTAPDVGESGVGHALSLQCWLHSARNVREKAAAEASNA